MALFTVPWDCDGLTKNGDVPEWPTSEQDALLRDQSDPDVTVDLTAPLNNLIDASQMVIGATNELQRAKGIIALAAAQRAALNAIRQKG
jgi:hypothetical protein